MHSIGENWYDGSEAWRILAESGSNYAWGAMIGKDLDDDAYIRYVSSLLEQMKAGFGLTLSRKAEIDLDGPIAHLLTLLKLRPEDIEVDEIANKVSSMLGEAQETREVLAVDERQGVLVHPQDCGMGVSQVVPVVVALTAPNTKACFVEQPELHLHPALQCELGDVLLESMNRWPERLFVIETHSEHLILRLLRRIRETTENELPPEKPALRPEQVAVYYIQGGKTGMKATHLPIAPDGDFTRQWPQGFFEERAEELF